MKDTIVLMSQSDFSHIYVGQKVGHCDVGLKSERRRRVDTSGGQGVFVRNPGMRLFSL